MSYIVVVECIIQNEDKFLFIKRPKGVHAAGLLAFPGGKVDYSDGKEGSNILEIAVRREVLEEVGLDLIDPIEFVTSSYFIDIYNNHVLDIIFYCNIKNSNNIVKASKREVPEYFWLTYNEAFNNPLAQDWLKRYLSSIGENHILKQ